MMSLTRVNRYLIFVLFSVLFVSPSQAQLWGEPENAVEEKTYTRLKGWRQLYGEFDAYEYKKTIDQIPAPYAATQDSTKNPRYTNEMRVLNSGLGSLYARLDMIRRAERRIDIEYFIFDPKEKSSRVLIQELMIKADLGVKVRIIVDKSISVFQFKPYIIDYIKSKLDKPENFEVRFYNAAPLWQVSSLQFRDHRKLLMIDDSELITGGRNLEDKYFDLDEEFNYMDRDVWVKGTIAPIVRKSFEEYWNHPIVEHYEKPSYRNEETRAQMMKKARDAVNFKRGDSYLVRQIDRVGKSNMELLPIRSCPVTSYSTDKPGGNFKERLKKSYKEEFRIVERSFGKRLRKSRKVHISSPYFMMNTRTGRMMDELSAYGVEMTLLTNSLQATDAVYVSSAFYRVVNDWAEIGVQSYLHNAKYHENDEQVVLPKYAEARWGLHSKTHVYFYRDGTDGMMIGTYNVDNRSSFYNNEMAIFCDGSTELTHDVYDDIVAKMERTSNKVVGEELAEAPDGSVSKDHFYGGAKQSKINLMKGINAPVELLQFLL
jgi:putative cardiolipin synthase